MNEDTPEGHELYDEDEYLAAVEKRVREFADDIAAVAVDAYMGADSEVGIVTKQLVNYVLGLLK